MKTLRSLVALLLLSCSSATHSLKQNETIVFLGDSITQLGVQPKGYVTIIKESLLQHHPSATVVGAGISGNKVPDLRERLERDVLAKQPTIVFIYIGINDVWHSILPGRSGTPKDQFGSGLREIIGKIQHAGARVILCTPTVIGEKKDGANQLDAQLDDYAAVSRLVASETGSQLCDLRRTFIDYLKSHNPENNDKGILTRDAVHLNDEGNMLVAREMLGLLK
jgi:lysophospholipase L1-like esterase